jgi:hypothetical protein
MEVEFQTDISSTSHCNYSWSSVDTEKVHYMGIGENIFEFCFLSAV